MPEWIKALSFSDPDRPRKKRHLHRSQMGGNRLGTVLKLVFPTARNSGSPEGPTRK